MGYTIVYDRLFIRAGDMYVPLCLYGSSNVTEFVNGREVRERRWELFYYCDDMILADKETIMREVRDRHTGECGQNFKFRSNWLDDAAVIRFFENGIKNAVTIEDVMRSVNGESLYAKLSCWPSDGSWAKTEFNRYLRTSQELVDWLLEAKDRKADMLKSRTWSSIYISCGFIGRDPIKAVPLSTEKNPVIAKDGKQYVSAIPSPGCWSLSPRIEDAMVFANAKKAYVELPEYPFLLVSAKKKEASAKKTWVLSVLCGPSRVYIHKLSRRGCQSVCYPEIAGKRFASENEALKWYAEKIQPRYPRLTAPVPVRCDA